MAKGQVRGNREMKKPETVKAPASTGPDARSNNAVLDPIAVPGKR